MSKLRILVVDDFELVRRGVRALLEARPEWRICGEAAFGREAVEKVRRLAPDLMVLDSSMPDLDALEVTREVLKAHPQTEILILCGTDLREEATQLLAAGARGLVLKSDAAHDLVLAVEALSQHKPFLSPRVTELVLRTHTQMAETDSSPRRLTAREREVLKLLAEGNSNKEAARILGISRKTVEAHRANLMRKLKLRSVAGLVHFAIRNKIVEI